MQVFGRWISPCLAGLPLSLFSSAAFKTRLVFHHLNFFGEGYVVVLRSLSSRLASTLICRRSNRPVVIRLRTPGAGRTVHRELACCVNRSLLDIYARRDANAFERGQKTLRRNKMDSPPANWADGIFPAISRAAACRFYAGEKSENSSTRHSAAECFGQKKWCSESEHRSAIPVAPDGQWIALSCAPASDRIGNGQTRGTAFNFIRREPKNKPRFIASRERDGLSSSAGQTLFIDSVLDGDGVG